MRLTGKQKKWMAIFSFAVVGLIFDATAEFAVASIIGVNAELTDGSFVPPTDMFQASGNDVGGNLTQTEQRILSEFNYDLELIGKTDDSNSGPFVDGPTDPQGYLTLDAVTSGPLVVTLKAGNGFAAFLFVESGIVGFQYDTESAGLTNPRGKGLGLSHASLFASAITTPPPVTPPPVMPPPITTPPSSSVPEPSSFVLFSGLLLICALAKSGRFSGRHATRVYR